MKETRESESDLSFHYFYFNYSLIGNNATPIAINNNISKKLLLRTYVEFNL